MYSLQDLGYMPTDHPVASVFYDASIAGSLDQRNTHMINPGGSITSHYHSAATYYTMDGEALFALASSSGNILLVKMPPLGMQGKILNRTREYITELVTEEYLILILGYFSHFFINICCA